MTASNNTYTLREFFLGRSNGNYDDYRKIIIPDMQREYCWPSEINPVDGFDLVSSFVKTLVEMSKESSPVKMGLLYGYESPQFNIQLCDGQQRLTTLYLTIGLLYKSICQETTDKEELATVARSILISDFKENFDDKEPRFQYVIRESTLYFLRDLVENYFLGKNTLEDIPRCEWYFEEYTLDPSIVNINKGLKQIHDIIAPLSISDKEQLLDYIINKLSFLYFDMKDRAHEEEQFVVINTTGKALSFSENLKPVLLGGLTDQLYKGDKTELQFFSDMWEDWEQFFWSKRSDKNASNFVSDNQLEEFFRWVYIIEMSLRDNSPASSETSKYNAAQRAYGSRFNLLDITSDVKSLLLTINSYMKAYKAIVEKGLWVPSEKQPIPFQKALSVPDCFRFIPLLYFVKQFCVDNTRQALRAQRLLWELSKHTNYNEEIATVEMIRAIKVLYDKHAKEADIAMLANEEVYSLIRQSLLPADSIIKLHTYTSCTTEEERMQYEHTIWDIENMSCCEGDLSFFYNEFIDKNVSHPLPLSYYQRLLDVLSQTANKPNTLFRRSLLTKGDYYENLSYSRRLDLYTYSFAKDAAYFKSVFRKQTKEESRNIIMPFLKNMYDSEFNPKTFMENCINEYCGQEHDVDEDKWKCLLHLLIIDPSLFDYAHKGVVCYNDSREGQPIARVFEQETLSQGRERTVVQLGNYHKDEPKIETNNNE